VFWVLVLALIREGRMIFVGVDWAEAHHDVRVADEEGRRLGGGLPYTLAA
jgi:hypothetical protein